MEQVKESDYEKQADQFLWNHRLRLTVGQKPAFNSCPSWEDSEEICRANGHLHGQRYNITLSRGLLGESYKEIKFSFWGSKHDDEQGKNPTAYDVLACIGSEYYCPDSFEDFCSAYGYDPDSRKAEKTYKQADAFAKRLRAFFTEDEASALSEIQ